MLLNTVNFMHSLLTAAVTRAAAQSPAVTLLYAPGSGQRNLWRNKAVEDGPNTPSNQKRCGDPYTVARKYGGDQGDTAPTGMASVQFKTVGKVDDDAMLQALAVHEAVAKATDGLPLKNFQIAGLDAKSGAADGHWMIVWANTIVHPGQIGRDDSTGRVEIVSHVDFSFFKQA